MAEYNPSKIIKDGNTYNFRDTTKIPLSGSNQISGDLIPSTDGTVNLGGPSYQWNNAYIKSLTINGVACGDILTHNVSEFVNITSNQTIGGNKTFNIVGASDSLKAKKYINFNDNTNIYISGGSGWNLGGQINLVGKDNVTIDDSGNIVTDGGDVALRCASNLYGIFDVILNVNNSIKEPQFSPTHNKINLGTSTNKWKSFNGINPGALSLPSSSYINVDTTSWDLTCQNGKLGVFTPTADGWLMLHINNSGTNVVNFWIIGGALRINNKSTFNDINNDNFNMLTIPVTKGTTYNIYGMASEYATGRSIAFCRFTPCQGNV